MKILEDLKAAVISRSQHAAEEARAAELAAEAEIKRFEAIEHELKMLTHKREQIIGSSQFVRDVWIPQHEAERSNLLVHIAGQLTGKQISYLDTAGSQSHFDDAAKHYPRLAVLDRIIADFPRILKAYDEALVEIDAKIAAFAKSSGLEAN